MPERINKLNKRVDSTEVQGEGSYVLIQAPTLEDVRSCEVPEIPSKMANLEYTALLLGRLVKKWNWVDDDGEPLPEPSEEVIANLPYAELKFLADALEIEKLTDQKN